jgi:hypothetical protein
MRLSSMFKLKLHAVSKIQAVACLLALASPKRFDYKYVSTNANILAIEESTPTTLSRLLATCQ